MTKQLTTYVFAYSRNQAETHYRRLYECARRGRCLAAMRSQGEAQDRAQRRGGDEHEDH